MWKGKVAKGTGYGVKQFGGRTVLAHRWVYSWFNGWIPDGLHLDHKCRVRACVNPDHLEAVTRAENSRRGMSTKLTRDQAAEIKRRIPSLRWGERRKIALEFGVSEGLISDIKYGRAWADLEQQ